MAAAFGAAHWAAIIAARINFRLAQETRRRQSREDLYWRALSALPSVCDE
jgi:hypothetical protein